MTTYFVRRLATGVLTVLVVSVLTFLLVRMLPGDVLLAKLGENGHLSGDQLARARHSLGLDRPLPEDLGRWLLGLLHGDLGRSLLYDQQTVLGRIGEALPITLELSTIAIVVTLIFGIPAGILSALFQDGPLDYLLRTIAAILLAMPQFWIAIMVLLYLSIWFHYAPPLGYTAIVDNPSKNLQTFYIPGILIGTRIAAAMMRITRSSILEVQREDYVRTARAKGLTTRTVLSRHILKNGAIPIVTLFGTQVAFLFAGSVVIEVIFGLPGLGWLTYSAILARDYTQIEGCILLTAALIIGMNLVIDLSYGFLNPRISQA